MQGMLFNAAQNYAWILEFSKKLLAHESSGENANKTEHQINTRLFNNAFCGLLRLGYPHTISNDGPTSYLVLTIEDTEYKCPVVTASNVLREEFGQCVPDAVALIPQKKQREKSKNLEDSEQSTVEKAIIDSKKTESKSKNSAENTLSLPSIKLAEKNVNHSESVNSKYSADKNPDVTSDEKKQILKVPPKHQEKVIGYNKETQPKANTSNIPMNTGFPNLDDLSFVFAKGSGKVQNVGSGSEPIEISASEKSEPEQKEGGSFLKNDLKNIEKTLEDRKSEDIPIVSKNESLDIVALPQMETDFMLPPEYENEDELPESHTVATLTIPSEKEIKIISAESNEKTENVTENHEIFAHTASTSHFFKPKNQPIVQPVISEKSEDELESDSTDLKVQEEKRGLFSFFKKEKGEKREGITPKANPAITMSESPTAIPVPEPAPIESLIVASVDQSVFKHDHDAKEDYDYSQDSGKLFQHIHQVIVKPRFGDVIVSRARFIIWPTRIIAMHTGNTFADFLVHITDASGNEQIFCTDGKVKQLKMTVDGKQYCVYGIWNNSVFESHVVLDDKSASMFRMEEEVQKQEPEESYKDAFLDQFRYDHKGQPFHFIVPFSNGNRGELNIPIVGFVSIDGKKYPLERCDGNTLRYRTRTKAEKIIRGHWEKGSFVFSIDDATKLLWEEAEATI